MDDAELHYHKDVAALLEASGGRRCKEEQGWTWLADDHEGDKQQGTDSGASVELIWAASEGDLRAIQRLVARGVDLEGADYDHRTALHLAASEGHEHLVQYFGDQAVQLAPLDRWGGTPLDDARRHGHERAAQLLEKLSKDRG